MRNVLGIMISCLVLLAGLFFVENDYFIYSAKAQTSRSAQNNELRPHKTYKQKTEFMFLVERKLKQEGYSSTIARMLYTSQGKQEITIEISYYEYKGEQTKENINQIINHLAKENKLGSIVVHVTINYSGQDIN